MLEARSVAIAGLFTLMSAANVASQMHLHGRVWLYTESTPKMASDAISDPYSATASGRLQLWFTLCGMMPL